MAKVKKHVHKTSNGLSGLYQDRNQPLAWVVKIRGQHDLQAAQQLGLTLYTIKVRMPHDKYEEFQGISCETEAVAAHLCAAINRKAKFRALTDKGHVRQHLLDSRSPHF